MTRRRSVYLESNANAKIDFSIGQDEEGFGISVEGKLDIYENGRSTLRKLTKVEQHDFKNSMRTMISEILDNEASTDFGDTIEQITLGVCDEYRKEVVRSYLKRFTPKGLKVNVSELAKELELDEELIRKVMKEFSYLSERVVTLEEPKYDLDSVLYADVRAGAEEIEKDLNIV